MKANFDEWMSGRYWLGDKAPAEGFYGRYTHQQLFDIKLGFEVGSELRQLHPDTFYAGGEMSEDDIYLMKWARDVGESLTRKLNE